MADETIPMGPVSYLIVEFPGSRMTGEGLPILVDLVDRGLIRVLDLTFVSKRNDGAVDVLELRDLDGSGRSDLSIFEGAASGILDESDLADAAGFIEPGSSAAVLLFENRWATDFVRALRRGGAEVVSAGYVPQDAILASLDGADR